MAISTMTQRMSALPCASSKPFPRVIACSYVFMIVACFIMAVIAVMLLLIEIKKKGNTLHSYVNIKSQIFIFTAALQLSMYQFRLINV